MELNTHDRALVVSSVTELADSVEQQTVDMEAPAQRFLCALVAARLLLRSAREPEVALHLLLESYKGLIDDSRLN
jgi:hypothetical protein